MHYLSHILEAPCLLARARRAADLAGRLETDILVLAIGNIGREQRLLVVVQCEPEPREEQDPAAFERVAGARLDFRRKRPVPAFDFDLVKNIHCARETRRARPKREAGHSWPAAPLAGRRAMRLLQPELPGGQKAVICVAPLTSGPGAKPRQLPQMAAVPGSTPSRR
jgi:hypothetical protein